MPNRYAYHYRGTRLTYEYPTISVLDYSDEELESSHNPFAQVIIAARIRLLEQKIPEEELLNIKLLAARKLYAKGFDRDKIRAVFTFLRNYVLFEKPEMNRKFDDLFAQTDKTSVMNTVEYLRMEGREEGLAEGLKKGLERGKREGKKEATRTIVENLLRNSDYPIEKIASSCGVSIDFVNDIKKKIL
jgi:flagellar biosynthesis/type III secretory pathway protein FliH